eukprot:TRINITY_DN1204_c0_g1_i1.p1 TRINITY_DN1204_c0_g1~~TRINITY_DN1204_c0_g1_i1.p1  ORF type:complete len:299 (+),score=71.94 TRINITY_DN1204_c0_g1_i1:29-898(+)
MQFSTSNDYGKLPKSRPYSNVQSRIDTGASMKNFYEKNPQHRRHVVKKQSSKFKMIKDSTLSDWINIEAEERPLDISPPLPKTSAGKTRQTDVDPYEEESHYSESMTHYSMNQSSISFNDDELINRTLKTDLVEDFMELERLNKCKYILVDIRSPAEWQCCHIISSRCFPKSRMSRAQNSLTAELITFKERCQNDDSAVVVLYDIYNQDAIPMAEWFFDQGFPKVAILKGGLAGFCQSHPENVIGDISSIPEWTESTIGNYSEYSFVTTTPSRQARTSKRTSFSTFRRS